MTTAALRRPFGALMFCLIVAIAVLAALSSGAGAAVVVPCPGTSGTPFAQFGDSDSYVLAPAGDMEAANLATSGWTLTGGAAQAAGNEAYFANSKADTHSLSIPAGATATSPLTCVNLADPTIRFFSVAGNASSTLTVAVVATLANGTSVTVPVAKIAGGSAWAPTPTIYFYANLLALKSANGQASVRFRFSVAGTAAFRIDDLYLDPRKGH